MGRGRCLEYRRNPKVMPPLLSNFAGKRGFYFRVAVIFGQVLKKRLSLEVVSDKEGTYHGMKFKRHSIHAYS